MFLFTTIISFLKTLFIILKKTFVEYWEDDLFRLGAALAYYTIFSLPPIIIIVIALVGQIYGKDAVAGEIYNQISDLIGHGSALQIEAAVASIAEPYTNWLATVFGIGILIFGATGVFNELQYTFNLIFEVNPKKHKTSISIIRVVLNRLVSFTMIVCLGFILLVSLIINALLVAFHKILVDQFPELANIFLTSTNAIISFTVISFFFALLYKVLPDVQIRWRDIIPGAIFTSVFFWLGKLLISYYLGNTDMLTAYGAAGSVVVILLWVYYTSQILFLGAEFTKTYCDHFNIELKPTNYAVKVYRRFSAKDVINDLSLFNEKEES